MASQRRTPVNIAYVQSANGTGSNGTSAGKAFGVRV